MNPRGSCAVTEVQVKVSCCDVGFDWITNDNLENFARWRWSGRCNVRMSVGVVGRSEFVGDGIFKYVFGNAATPWRW